MTALHPWITCLQSGLLIRHLDTRYPAASSQVDFQKVMETAESFQEIRDAKTFLADPSNWIPLSVFRDLVKACELASGEKDFTYHAARSYYDTVKTETPTLLETIVILLNNRGYSTEREILEGPFNDVHEWQYEKVCDLIGGGKGSRVSTQREFEQHLAAAFADQLRRQGELHRPAGGADHQLGPSNARLSRRDRRNLRGGGGALRLQGADLAGIRRRCRTV